MYISHYVQNWTFMIYSIQVSITYIRYIMNYAIATSTSTVYCSVYLLSANLDDISGLYAHIHKTALH